LWIDRIYFDHNELQRTRLGGVALQRGYVYPGNAVSWKMEAPANDQSLGILIPESTPDHLKILIYNLDQIPVKVKMTGWEVDPGKWEMVQDGLKSTVEFERSKDVELTLAPHVTSVIEMRLVEKGVPYWSRPDLGIDPEDVKVEGARMRVTVHSLGSVEAPASVVVVRDRAGKEIGRANVPGIKAPVDLLPKTAAVSVAVPAGADWKGGSVTVERKGDVPEITLLNNRVVLE
jgi:hypothetical protein